MGCVDASYSKKSYVADVESRPLDAVWDDILDFMADHGETDFLTCDGLGELYELGLSIKDKFSKRRMGVYYTPKDVADVMGEYYVPLLGRGSRVCDVCAGTGNLILSVLGKMPERMRFRYLSEGRVFLYDLDPLALKIAVARIGMRFGRRKAERVHVVAGDFMSADLKLPDRAVVISNPPYFKIESIDASWAVTDLMLASRECYGVFMEKCIAQAKACVFISPHSFVCGAKFYHLREQMNGTDAKVIVFDNVPGNIFKGRKYGIFNSNTANMTRPAITVIKGGKALGAKVSPMVRFATKQRATVLDRALLDSLVDGQPYQVVSEQSPMYRKCDVRDLAVFDKWASFDERFGDIVCDHATPYRLDVPTTCRYFTSASSRGLTRDGKYVLHFEDEQAQALAYVLLNSSFAYWFWRVYDGAITYPQRLMEQMPIRFADLDEDARERIVRLFERARECECEFFVYKRNANKTQENLKFSGEWRDRFNDMVGQSFGLDLVDFERIHSPEFM